jgi:hypothetical protein
MNGMAYAALRGLQAEWISARWVRESLNPHAFHHLVDRWFSPGDEYKYIKHSVEVE